MRVGASASMSCAATTSVGMRSRPVPSRRRHVVDHVGLDERVADLAAPRDLERERHRAADQDRVAPVEERLDHAELVADLGAAEHREERTRRVPEQAREHLDLALQQDGRPRTAASRGGPTIDACARCDAPNASFT